MGKDKYDLNLNLLNLRVKEFPKLRNSLNPEREALNSELFFIAMLLARQNDQTIDNGPGVLKMGSLGQLLASASSSGSTTVWSLVYCA